MSPPGETNRLFIVEKSGRIQVISDLRNPSSSVFLDLATTTFVNKEAGLLGFAFHPGFATNGRFFVYRVTRDAVFHDVLSEFHSAPSDNTADPATEKVIISQMDIDDTHNAGDLKFGPDGYLYLSIGDSGPNSSEQHAAPQAIDKGLFGGIIRIDVDANATSLSPNDSASATGNYRIPADNPFIGVTEFNGSAVDPAAVRTELYAVGLRNPWRFTFDPSNGHLICADVGGGNFEEINIIRKGGNYGWPFFEGEMLASSQPTPDGLESPAYAYPHGQGLFEGNVVIGGLVYRGPEFPELNGKYLFTDFISGNIWALNLARPSPQPEWLTGRGGISSFGLNPADGGILVANHIEGIIERLIYRNVPNEVPALLSDTHAFSDLRSLTPASSLVPYDVNNPLWSDGAVKQRWIDMSGAAGRIKFSATQPWIYPGGAVWVKNFELELTNGIASSRRRVETRFLVTTTNDIYGLTYRWDDAQTNAVLVPPEGASETFTIQDGGALKTLVWNFPTWQQCRTCHNQTSDRILGFIAPQLNKPLDSEGKTNLLSWLASREIFSNPQDIRPETLPSLVALTNSFAPAQAKVRSYLQSNCSHCHQPGGLSDALWDGRYSTPLSRARILDAPALFYGAPMKIIAAHSLENSFIYQKAASRAPTFQMPPLATTVTDPTFLQTLLDWVDTIPSVPWISKDIGPAIAEGAAEQRTNYWRLSSTARGLEQNSVFFVGREAFGSTEVVAELTSVGSTSGKAEAGLMLRNSLDPASASAALIFRQNEVRFLVHSAGAQTWIETGSSATVGANVQLRLAYSDRAVSAWIKSVPDDWKLISAAQINLGTNYMAGLATAAGLETSEYAAAQFDLFSVNSIGLADVGETALALPRRISLSAAVSEPFPSNGRVTFMAGAKTIASLNAPPWKVFWTNAEPGLIPVTVVLEANGASLASPPVFFDLGAPAAEVWLGSTDTSTLGNWDKVYGQELISIPGVAAPVGNTNIFVASNGYVTRLGNSDDPSALRWNNQGVASLLRAQEDLLLSINAKDLNVHKGALYFADWLNLGTEQVVSFSNSDPSNPQTSRTVSAQGGTYLLFVFRGDLNIRIHNPAGAAYVTGVFIDPIKPVSVTLNSPAGSLQLKQPVEFVLHASATAPGREVTAVEFWDDDQKLTTLYSPPFDLPLSTLYFGNHELRAVAHGSYGLFGQSPPVSVNILPPASEARYLGKDTNTLGSWMPRYGADGYLISGNSTNLAPFVNLRWENSHTYVSRDSILDVHALQRPGEDLRIAAYQAGTPEFSAIVDLLDGEKCTVGFYFLDWEDVQRDLDISVENEAGIQLDRRHISNFASGEYLFWEIIGHARFRFSSSGVNAVASGFFVDRGLDAFQLWKFNNFTNEQLVSWGNDSELADADEDGFNNATEYLLGYNPNLKGEHPELRCSVQGSNLIVSLTTQVFGAEAPLRFESSNDLVHWTPQEPNTALRITGTQSESIQFRLEINNPGKMFFRFLPILP